jgi:predicted lysophospholipase L1 biosynthesis ABC-type transport system permease subunit
VTIVGIARDARLRATDTKTRPELYRPMAQAAFGIVNFIAVTAGEPSLVGPDLKRAVWRVAPRMPIEQTSDLATIASVSVGRARFFSWTMSFFAAVAVVLSALGVYGLLAFAVTQRRREIGVRVALGATPARIGGLVLGRALRLGIAGVVLGVVFARLLTRFLESLLLEVSATDGTVFVATAVAALGVALVAACMPAVQALRVDPAKSLRV